MALYNLDFLNAGQQWPPVEERARLETYVKNKKLYSRTKKNYYEYNNVNIILNYYRILALKLADLAVGNEPPVLVTDNNETLNRIKAKNNLNKIFYQNFLDMPRYGISVVKQRYAGNLYLDVVDPSIYFRIVDEDNVQDTLAHVIAYVFTDKEKTSYLRVEIHGYEEMSNGDRNYYIENRLYKLNGNIIYGQLPLNYFDKYSDMEERIETGLDDFMVHIISNSFDSVYGEDDFSIAYTVVEALERNINQINKILEKNSDPTLMGPDSIVHAKQNAVTEQQAGVFDDLQPTQIEVETEVEMVDPRGKYVALGKDDRDLKYVTLDTDLAAAFKQYDTLTKALYMLTEMSPALWGEIEPGYANSGVALKRLLIPTLSKINRLRIINEDVFKNIIYTSSEIINKYEPEMRPINDVKIKWFDGLPNDAKENAEVNEIRIRSGQASIREIKAEEGYEDTMLLEIVEEIREGLQNK